MKRHLAYFSPLPPARTGIADYSLELLPHLARLAGVSLFSDDHARSDDPQLAEFAAYSTEEYPRQRGAYDLALYQMGNSVYHETIAANLLRYPGIMVLHDYGLHHLWSGQTIGAGNGARYVREMGYALGLPGVQWAADALAGRCPVPEFEVPLNDRFVDTALGVIVHSNFVEQLLRHRNPRQRIAVVPAPIALKQTPSLRARLGLPERTCLFGSFGLVSHFKQLEAALVAFSAVLRSNPHCHYLVVGEWHAQEVDVPGLIERLGLTGAVSYIGYAPTLHEFLGWLAAADVVVNLRYPTVGETSAVALRALAAGRALIVHDLGWYGELPEDACLRVPPRDEAALTEGMRRLAEDADFRESTAARGQAYVREHHAVERTAAAYMAFVEEVLRGRSAGAG